MARIPPQEAAEMIMAKQNLAIMYGRVKKSPTIFSNRAGERSHATLYLDVVRGPRSVGDHVKGVKHDYPLIITREPEILDVICDWKENDIVLVKGVVSTQRLAKTSFCEKCSAKNTATGNLVYITPIYAKKIAEYDEKTDAVEDLVMNREISNQVFIYGTLLKDPKLFTTKRGTQISQYPIAINRKLTIRTDDPSIKTDYPVVKSYGEQARDDKTYLRYQADVIVDGFLQARSITRNAKCTSCGEFYQWKDNAMEIVPYAVEYVAGHRTPEDVEREEQLSVEAYKNTLMRNHVSDELDEDLKTDDLTATE